MASVETVDLNDSHLPHANAIEAFTIVLPTIKNEILKSRHHWDKHEPRMWSRASDISDDDLVNFDVNVDLVKIRSGSTSYGTVIFGKIRIPAIYDEEGQGFIHVRIHDPPNRGAEDVRFHSIFTDEGKSEDGQIVYWRAIQTADTPLEFFNE
ncbi:hypothetical protein C0995_006266 [Termitomyces sp. Mi166|nr:hypothetical protein C0995_006266 [Termitomyces sp. Mi166\